MTPQQHSRLMELFAAFSQETLTEAEHREMQTALRVDMEARKFWFLYQDLELGLNCLAPVVKRIADNTGENASVGPHSAILDVRPTNPVPAISVKSSRVSGFGRRVPMIAAVALLCLSAMVMFAVSMLRRSADSDLAVGSMVTSNQAGKFTVESPTHGTKFTLPNQSGKLIALHFLLKTECPFCLKLAHDYAQLTASNSDVMHVFLKPDTANEIKVWARKLSQDGLKNSPVIYRDPDARLAKEFSIPDGYLFHGQTVHYPALVLLDNTGKELFRYVGKDNTDRMKPDDFIARLAMATDHK